MKSSHFWMVQCSYLPAKRKEQEYVHRRNIQIYVIADTIEQALAMVRAEDLPELKITGISFRGLGEWLYQTDQMLLSPESL